MLNLWSDAKSESWVKEWYSSCHRNDSSALLQWQEWTMGDLPTNSPTIVDSFCGGVTFYFIKIIHPLTYMYVYYVFNEGYLVQHV